MVLCKYCKKEFVPSRIDTRIVFCSKKCREKHFYFTNPDKIREYRHRWYNKRLPKCCKQCGKVLRDRTNGKVYCNECRKYVTQRRNKIYRERGQKIMHDFKSWVGCQLCGYNKFSGALDFQHTRKKNFRPVGRYWLYPTKRFLEEVNNCVVICSNCHRELTHKRSRNV